MKGRMFGPWITTGQGIGVRSNGYNVGDLIENPAYIIESILRDELYTERDLFITSKTDNSIYAVNSLLNTVNNYYDNSYFYNVRNGGAGQVAYNFGTTLVLWSDVPSLVGDPIYLTNVKATNRIDIASFDAIGNTINGLRDDWKFGRSIYELEKSEDLFKNILYESFCVLYGSSLGIKIIALDATNTMALLTLPLYSKQRRGYMIDINLSSLLNIYTDFTLNYFFEYGKKEYIKQITVNKDKHSDIVPAELQTKCRNAEINYRVKKRWEYSSNWIYDDTTAVLFFTKMVEWLTKQRLLIEWGISIEEGIKYEYGDQVKIDFDYMLPDAVRDYNFMVWGKKIVTTKRAGYVVLRLLQMPEETVTFRKTKDGKLRVTKDGKKRIIKGA